MLYVFFLSKENIKLAQEEVKCLYSETKFSEYENILIGKIDKELFNKNISRLAYTKTASKLIKSIKNKELSHVVKESSLENTYKINVDARCKSAPSTINLADALYSHLENPKVDVNNPDHNYIYLWLKNEILLTEKIYVNKDRPRERRAHLKEYNHPTSMHPKLARAMINLANVNSITDPFCGVGGIAIEGALMGLDVKGFDISDIMIKKAKINSERYGVKILFEKKDALVLDEHCDAIVTDLPYGKNSFISTNDLPRKFVVKAQALTKKMVLGITDKINTYNLLKNTKWKIKKEFEIYVHKSLTRKIIVLIQ